MRWALIGGSDIAATQVIPALRACGEEPAIVLSSGQEWAQRFASDNDIPSATTDLDEALSGLEQQPNGEWR